MRESAEHYRGMRGRGPDPRRDEDPRGLARAPEGGPLGARDARARERELGCK